MGKKKSVVLMIILTIVMVAISVITLVPFPILGTVQSFNPTVLQFDLGAEFDGGYYAYYYPEGVKTETAFIQDGDSADDYVKHGSLYLSKDEKYNLIDEKGNVNEYFEEEFAKATAEITKRFETRGYTDYRVSVVDDYAIRVELPASDALANATLTSYYFTGGVTLTKGTTSSEEVEVVDALKAEDAKMTDYISGFSLANNYKWSYLKINLTQKGKDLMQSLKASLSNSNTSSSANVLYLQIGDEKLTAIYKDSITENDVRVMFVESNPAVVQTYEVLLNSALHHSFEVDFTASEIATFDAVYGDNALTLLYIALGVTLLAIMVAGVVTMGRFGIVNVYANMTYLLIVANFFAFITGNSVFEFSLGSAFIFLLGFVLFNVIQHYIYRAIKAEFSLGKTIESSVKGAYKKTLWHVIDVYVVALLGALALILGGAGLATLAWQSVICILSAAFCNLLWARAINFVFLSASKDKYKYFRFVREDDDDE